jgi:hypothetical protein
LQGIAEDVPATLIRRLLADETPCPGSRVHQLLIHIHTYLAQHIRRELAEYLEPY